MKTFTFKTEDNRHTIAVDTKTGIVCVEGGGEIPPFSFPSTDLPINNSYRSYVQYYHSIRPEFRARFMLQIKRWKNHYLEFSSFDFFEGWLYWLENTDPTTISKICTLNDNLCGRYYFEESGLPSIVFVAIWRAFIRARQLPSYERIKPLCALLLRENVASLLSGDTWEHYFYEKLRQNDNFADVRNVWNDMVKVMERRMEEEDDI